MPSSHFTWESFQKNQPIVCRPALPKDTPDVMELTRTIWEGEDYVPKVWGSGLRISKDYWPWQSARKGGGYQ
jgi:hypothetical protein